MAVCTPSKRCCDNVETAKVEKKAAHPAAALHKSISCSLSQGGLFSSRVRRRSDQTLSSSLLPWLAMVTEECCGSTQK